MTVSGEVVRDGGSLLGPSLVSRYLRVLGISRKPPSMAALSELVQAHLTRVPFENVSKLLRRKHLGLTGLPGIALFLDGIERHHLGGTCYSNNYHLHALLRTLGYEARLCGADMRDPDVHVVIGVSVDGRDHLVDVGYGAPFRQPMPLDGDADHVVIAGGDRYVLKPRDATGRSRLELHRDGVVKHGYVAKPEARTIGEFEAVIARSFGPDATFLNALLLARFFPDRSVRIRNLSVTESHGARTETHTLRSRDELATEIERCFEIPESMAAEAVAELGEMSDPWS